MRARSVARSPTQTVSGARGSVARHLKRRCLGVRALGRAALVVRSRSGCAARVVRSAARVPSARASHYITLHYITLHYITLHMLHITLHCILFGSSRTACSGSSGCGRSSPGCASTRSSRCRRAPRRAHGCLPVAHTAVTPPPCIRRSSRDRCRCASSFSSRGRGRPVLRRRPRPAAVCVSSNGGVARVRVRSAAPAAATTTHFLVAPQPAFDVAL